MKLLKESPKAGLALGVKLGSMETCNLSQAFSIFKENLPEIKEAVTQNLLHDLSQIPPVVPTEDEELMWVRQAVWEEKIKIATEGKLKVIKRIISTLEHTTTKPGAITDEHIARAKDFPIEELYDGKLFKGGQGRLVGRCPFHGNGTERTPSFYIMADNKAHCFGCQWHGDAIDYVMVRDGIKFIQAVKKLNNI